MTKAGKLTRLRGHLRRGRARIKRIATYNRRRRRAIRRLLAEQGSIVMFDDVDVSLIPPDAPAVAGYVDGSWPTFEALKASHPHAHRLSIAVSAEHDAHCLDVETGDASPDDVPGWIRRQQASWAGEDWRPAVYASKAIVPAVIASCQAAGIGRGEYRVWSADWTYQPHICSPSSCGASFEADSTQFSDRYNGVSLDASLCSSTFLPGAR